MKWNAVGGIAEAPLWETEHAQCAEAFRASALWQCIPMALDVIGQRPLVAQQEAAPVQSANPPGTMAASRVTKARLATAFRILCFRTTDPLRPSSSICVAVS
jgi:hypothetical protein